MYNNVKHNKNLNPPVYPFQSPLIRGLLSFEKVKLLCHIID